MGSGLHGHWWETTTLSGTSQIVTDTVAGSNENKLRVRREHKIHLGMRLHDDSLPGVCMQSCFHS